MAIKTPLGTVKDAVIGTIRKPVGVGQQVAGQVAGQVLGNSRKAVGAVLNRVPGRAGGHVAPAPSVPDRPATPAPGAARQDAEMKAHGDPLAPAARKAPAKRTAATTAPVKKGPVKNGPGAKKSATTKKTTAAKQPAKTTAPTPAEVAKKAAPAKKGTAKKGTAKTTPSGKLPARKPARTAAEVAAEEGPGVTTPVGTTGADVAHNPDTAETDLQQPGTEPLMDPATTKAVASEAQTLAAAAEPSEDGKA